DFLEPLIENLNNSKHESTGYKPQELMERPELQKETITEIHERMERVVIPIVPSMHVAKTVTSAHAAACLCLAFSLQQTQ
ncbi:MAG TPA: hypothetical protein VF120_01770, partial [Ktedonobacterales bacterium]